MPVIYLDYNIIAKVAGLPRDARVLAWHDAILKLANSGYRFALSAWHAYELAKSRDQEHIESCCDFVRGINPLWLSNSHSVKREEMLRFLKHGGSSPVHSRRCALHPVRWMK